MLTCTHLASLHSVPSENCMVAVGQGGGGGVSRMYKYNTSEEE